MREESREDVIRDCFRNMPHQQCGHIRILWWRLKIRSQRLCLAGIGYEGRVKGVGVASRKRKVTHRIPTIETTEEAV